MGTSPGSSRPRESLPAVLRWWATVEPQDPWLFYPHPRGWKWLDFDSAWRRVAAGAEWLGGLTSPGAVAQRAEVSVPALLLDLAVQQAGLWSVPVPPASGPAVLEHWVGGSWAGGSPADREVGGAVEPKTLPPLVGIAGPDPTADLSAHVPAGELPRVAVDGLDPAEPPPEPPATPASSAAGGCLAVAEQPWSRWTAERWAACAREISEELEGGTPSAARSGSRAVGRPPGPRPRDVAVLGEPLSSVTARLLFGWSLWSGAALVLEPQPGAYLATAGWARPTALAAGDGEALAVLRRRVAADDPAARARGGRRRPFGRLRAVLCRRAALPAEADARWWSERGIRLVALG